MYIGSGNVRAHQPPLPAVRGPATDPPLQRPSVLPSIALSAVEGEWYVFTIVGVPIRATLPQVPLSQDAVSEPVPEHSLPPCATEGFVQVLFLVLVPAPPHGTEHWDQAAQLVHPPLTGHLSILHV